MSELIEGGCLCGAIRFSFREKPVKVRACWCRTCQMMAAGNASISAFFLADSLIISGEPKANVRLAEGGSKIRHRFCSTCGTQLFADTDDAPGFVVVRVGTLDDREIGAPQSYIWTGSAPSWGYVDPDIPSCLAQPTN